jgi:hypothetical protein
VTNTPAGLTRPDAEWRMAVSRHMSAILCGRYRASRGDAAAPGARAGTRSFWPAYVFESVSCCLVNGIDQLQIRFTDCDRPDVVLGYQVNLAEARHRWLEQVGDRDPGRYPEMFAAELAWFMVCHIGVAEFTPEAGTEELPQWINRGDEVFGKLPDNPNMNTFHSPS